MKYKLYAIITLILITGGLLVCCIRQHRQIIEQRKHLLIDVATDGAVRQVCEYGYSEVTAMDGVTYDCREVMDAWKNIWKGAGHE